MNRGILGLFPAFSSVDSLGDSFSAFYDDSLNDVLDWSSPSYVINLPITLFVPSTSKFLLWISFYSLSTCSFNLCLSASMSLICSMSSILLLLYIKWFFMCTLTYSLLLPYSMSVSISTSVGSCSSSSYGYLCACSCSCPCLCVCIRVSGCG